MVFSQSALCINDQESGYRLSMNVDGKEAAKLGTLDISDTVHMEKHLCTSNIRQFFSYYRSLISGMHSHLTATILF